MNRRLLVTGAAGFIGANFVHYWLKKHPDSVLLAYDALTYAGNLASLNGLESYPGYGFVHADIRDTSLVTSLLRENQIDTIVHFAAESHVDRSISGPDAFIDTNLVGTHSLLKAARDVWLAGDGKPHRFHHVSTDEVFGSLLPEAPAFTETLAYAPNSPYAASKAGSDHLVRAYHRTYGLQVTTSNCSNNYGPYQFPEKLIPLCLTNLLRGLSLPIYGDGRNVRDWLYVADHCAGIDCVLERGRVGETYNIGGNYEWPNIAIIESLCDLLDRRFAEDPALSSRFPQAPPAAGQNSRSLITFVTDRLGHDRRYAIDSSKIESELGFRPGHNFDTGIGATLQWYLDREDWWRPLLPHAK